MTIQEMEISSRTRDCVNAALAERIERDETNRSPKKTKSFPVFAISGIIVELLTTACQARPPVILFTPTSRPIATPLPFASPSLPAIPTATETSLPVILPVKTPVVYPTKPIEPTHTSTPTPEAEKRSLFDQLLEPFVKEANRRRIERARLDPDYYDRVDKRLNEGRVNFLLFGYGETHEPPATEKAIIGSQTIISYDLRTHQADIISLTHDLRAPEIETEIEKQTRKRPIPQRIDKAYDVGGFPLMRRVLEDATGLSIDFQVAFDDRMMQGLVDDVFGGLEVDVPEAFEVQPFYLGGVKYPAGKFEQGRQRLSGLQAIQFIKTVPIPPGVGQYYGKPLEHNVRKKIVFEAMLEYLQKNYADRGFWLRSSRFLAGQSVFQNIVYDFNFIPFVVDNLGQIAELSQLVAQDKKTDMVMPKIRKSTYAVDKCCVDKDMGIRWVYKDVTDDPFMRKDIDADVYPNFNFEVPYNANPYGPPVKYWDTLRGAIFREMTTP